MPGIVRGVPPVASKSFSQAYSSPVSSVARRPTEVERDDAAPEPQIGPRVLRAPPDLRLVGTGPEAFRERRPRIRRMLLGADEDDRAVRVALPDSLDGGVAGHAAADDQIAR